MTRTIRTRAPGRVNLIGDHTDYTGGLVFPMAIDRWTEVSGVVADRIRLTSYHDEQPVDLPLDPPPVSAGWGRFVAAVAAEVRPTFGIEGVVQTTIPVGAGLSSSAALELTLALALGFEGPPLALAQLGRRAEHRATGVPCGIMDQLCIAAAKDGHATIIDCHSFDVSHVPIPGDVEIVVSFVAHRELEASGYAHRVAECAAAELVVGPLRTAALADIAAIEDPKVRRRARHVITENQRVRDFAAALSLEDYKSAGELMVESHLSLRDDFETSTDAMDRTQGEILRQRGVLGARMTGGGFGGCIVSLCEPGAKLDGWRVRPVAGAART